jgi:Prokaryotic phospholipase A2
MRTILRLLILFAAALLGVAALAAPAVAAAPADKPAVLASFTQATTASRTAWNAARLNQSAWAAYGFDWTTDYCSGAPDQPRGFDFRLPCWRHDFGYRNYKAIGTFPANKSRLDDVFYFDLTVTCATYSVAVRSSCNGWAWTYYQAVKVFGSISVSQAPLSSFAQRRAAALASSAAS